MNRFTVTYTITTPESAEHGDYHTTGFVTPGDWHWPMGDELIPTSGELNMSLREAMLLASPSADCGRWFEETGEDRCDYRSGAIEQRAIHPPQGITPASYRRVARILGAH